MRKNGLVPALAQKLSRKRLIFTVTTGRSGTKYLARALSRLDGVTSRHEPWPEFSEVMRTVQEDAGVARGFLVERKLPVIAQEKGHVYIETSHAFAKGFLEPLLALKIVPDLILLRRPPRDVALSLFKLGEIPGWSEWYLSPSDPDVLPLHRWYEMEDYQLCYWYCLEMERRMVRYKTMIATAGGLVAETSLADVTTVGGLAQLLSNLRLPAMSEPVRRAFEIAPPKPVNMKARDKREQPSVVPHDLDRLEQEVAEKVAAKSDDAALEPPTDLLARRRRPTSWIGNVSRIHEQVQALLRRGKRILLVDDGKLPDYISAADGVVPFTQQGGRYWGPPRNDAHAMAELARHEESGVDMLVLAWTAFWWLEEYPALDEALRARFARRTANEAFQIFDLKATFDTTSRRPD